MGMPVSTNIMGTRSKQLSWEEFNKLNRLMKEDCGGRDYWCYLPAGNSSVNYSKNKILWIIGSDRKSHFENGKLTKETKNKILNECKNGI